MAGTTLNYGWPYQSLTDPPDGADLGEDLATEIDADVKVIDVRLAGVETRSWRGNRATTKATAGASVEIGYLRLDAVPQVGGHTYRVTASGLRFVETVATGSNFKFNLRANTAGTATTASTLIGRAEGAVSAQSMPAAIGYLFPSVDGTVSVLLAFIRTSGGSGVGTIQGTDDQGIHLVIEDLGVNGGDVGIDA